MKLNNSLCGTQFNLKTLFWNTKISSVKMQCRFDVFILKKSGIDKILPCMKIDDYLFDPCGYSMNGILQNESVDYGLVS